MHWEYIFCLAYFSIAFWMLNKWTFFKFSGLTTLELRFLLLFKLILSLFAAFFLTRSNHPDYLSLNSEGYAQYQLLVSNPSAFFSDWTSDINNYGWGGLFSASHSFWANLRFSLIYKIIAVTDLLTQGNFYLNSLIFTSIVFVANVCFFKIFNTLYKGQKLKIIFTSFFIPSMLLYTAAVHKDGLMLICIAIISYLLFFGLRKRNLWNPKNILFFSITIFFLFLIRNYIAIVLFASLLLTFCYQYFEKKKRWMLLVTYLLMIFVFFIPLNNKNLAQSLINRKQEFLTLSKGNTYIELNELKPTVNSFLSNFSQAFNHSWFKPYLFEFKGWGVNLAAVEVHLYELLILLLLFFKKNKKESLHWFNFFGLCLLFHLFLIIGYTIPNVGAIVRYRSILWLFLITPVICNIDWDRLLRIFYLHKK